MKITFKTKALKAAAVFIVCSVSLPSYAAWISVTGEVDSILTYATRETVLVKLSSNGTSVEACSNTEYFAISKDFSAEANSRLYSMLLSAQASGRSVTLAYNDVDGCEPWGTAPNVYRKIQRLRLSK